MPERRMRSGNQVDSERQRGVIARWNAERGFGFITPDSEDPDLFVHIRGFVERSTVVKVGDRVSFHVELDRDGRQRAAAVEVLGSAAMLRGPGLGAVGAVIGFALLYLLAHFLWQLPFWPLLPVVVLSVITYSAYSADKSASRLGARRIPEAALHALALLGGWPGALLAQRILRHKTRKRGFQVVFWMSVVLSIGLVTIVEARVSDAALLEFLRGFVAT